MAVATRKIRFTYNGTTVPGTIGGATVTLHAVHSLRVSSRDFDASFSILVKASKDGLAAAVAAIRTAFTEPDKAFAINAVEDSSGTLFSADPSDRTALTTLGEVDKEGAAEADSVRSQLLRVNISGELPYTTDPAAGRKALEELEYEIAFDAARIRTLTINGSYTATAAPTTALAQYAAQIEDLFTEITTAIGGTWPTYDQPRAERQTVSRLNERMRFSLEYEELIFGESSATPLDDTDIGSVSLSITRAGPDEVESAPGFLTIGRTRLVATLEATINKTQTTDLDAKWRNVLRPWCVTNINNALLDGTLVFGAEEVEFLKQRNAIRARLEFEGSPSTGTFESYSVTTTDAVKFGVIFADIWPEDDTLGLADTEPTEAYLSAGPKEITRAIVSTYTLVGDESPPALSDPSQIRLYPQLAESSLRGDGRKVIPLEADSQISQRERGSTVDGGIVLLTDRTVTERLRIVKVRAAE